MKVSVVVCTYSDDRYEDFTEAVDSVLAQRHDPIEVVLVIDGNESVAARTRETYGDRQDVIVHCNDENLGVSVSRTKGAELASGEVVAFIDDDAIAEPDWIAELVRVYESRDALAVGGQMVGEWIAGRPWFLPDEFNWLVGVTHRGFAESGDVVRNTFESNISFRRDVFLDLGGFDPELGPTADSYSHSEGAEIGTRLQNEYGCGLVYTDDAIVSHKIFEHRTKLRWLLARAFEQGKSKHRMARRDGGGMNDEEYGFLFDLLKVHTPRRVRDLVRSPSAVAVGQLLFLFVFTACVGCGYLFAALNR